MATEGFFNGLLPEVFRSRAEALVSLAASSLTAATSLHTRVARSGEWETVSR
jgi:hypothetical protein